MINALSSPGSPDGRQTAAASSRRASILAAMLRTVGAKGYASTAIEDVLAEAEVSQGIFFELFEGKHDCFLAAYASQVDLIQAEVEAGCDGEQEWASRMTAGLATIVGRLAGDPDLARALTVEIGAAGPDARRLHWETIARFGELLDRGREPAADVGLPESISLMSAGAVSGLIFEEVLAGRAAELNSRLPDLVFALLLPYLGPEAAGAEVRRLANPH